MTLGGWITFLLSTGAFTIFFAWCMYKVITAKPKKEDALHGAFDISELAEDEKKYK